MRFLVPPEIHPKVYDIFKNSLKIPAEVSLAIASKINLEVYTGTFLKIYPGVFAKNIYIFEALLDFPENLPEIWLSICSGIPLDVSLDYFENYIYKFDPSKLPIRFAIPMVIYFIFLRKKCGDISYLIGFLF